MSRLTGASSTTTTSELSQFAFLIGDWRCEATLNAADGEPHALEARWSGRSILDGYAIEDEFRMMGPNGELMVLGVNLRGYDAEQKKWNMKWLNGLAGTWTDLGPEELGGVTFEGGSISYAFKQPMAVDTYIRATYANISEAHFTLRAEMSDDAHTWGQYMVLEAYRV